MTDVDALYSANPKDDPTAVPIYEVRGACGAWRMCGTCKMADCLQPVSCWQARQQTKPASKPSQQGASKPFSRQVQLRAAGMHLRAVTCGYVRLGAASVVQRCLCSV
eukprot:94375-Chlamydomonas_euryale.AAC.1